MSSTWLDSRYPDVRSGDIIVFKKKLSAWCYQTAVFQVYYYDKDLKPKNSGYSDGEHPSGTRFIYLGRDSLGKVWVHSPVLGKPVGLAVTCLDHGYMINP